MAFLPAALGRAPLNHGAENARWGREEGGEEGGGSQERKNMQERAKVGRRFFFKVRSWHQKYEIATLPMPHLQPFFKKNNVLVESQNKAQKSQVLSLRLSYPAAHANPHPSSREASGSRGPLTPSALPLAGHFLHFFSEGPAGNDQSSAHRGRGTWKLLESLRAGHMESGGPCQRRKDTKRHLLYPLPQPRVASEPCCRSLSTYRERQD